MKKFLGLFISAAMIFGLFTGCEVGLGEAVDTQPPELKVNYPEDGVIIRNSFTMSGTATDETGIRKIQVRFVSTSDSEKVYGPYEADIDSAKKTWSALINKAENDSFPIPDGEYTAEVTAFDNGNRSTIKSKVYKIDNTAPFVVIKRPGKSDSYGRTIKVTGDITDSNNLSALYFTAYKSTDGKIYSPISVNYNGQELKTQTFQNISGVGLELIVGKKDSSDPLQKAVYDAYWNAEEGGTQDVFAIIEVADNAKEYTPQTTGARAPALGNSEPASGNLSSCYYLYNDIYDSIYSESKGFGLTNSQIVTVLNGTYGNSEKIPEIKQALAEHSINTSSEFTSADISKFSINPANSPVFDVGGYSLAEGFNDISNNNPINITITPGRDQYSIRDATVGVYLQQYDRLTKKDVGEKKWLVLSQSDIDALPDGTEAESAAKSAAQSVRDSSVMIGDNVRVTVKIGVLDNKKYYKIIVTGNDLEGNYIEPSAQEGYGFLVKNTGTAPTLTVEEGNEDLSVANKAEFAFAGSIKSLTSDNLEVSYTLSVKNEKVSSEEVKTYSESVAIAPDVENEGFYKFNVSIPYDTLVQKQLVHNDALYLYSITFKCRDIDGELDAADVTRRIHVDTEKPVVSISSVSPIVKFESEEDLPSSSFQLNVPYVNGEITVNATAEDNYNLDKTTYCVYKYANGVKGESLFAEPKSAGEAMSFGFKVDTTAEGYQDNSQIYIEVVSRDKAGNVSDVAGEIVTICQATDKPIVKLSNADVSVTAVTGVNVNTNLFDQTGNNKILGNIRDDDGISSVVVEYQADGASTWNKLVDANPRGQTTYSLSAALKTGLLGTTPLAEGVYKIRLTVKDKNNHAGDAATDPGITINEFYIAIDAAAPVIKINTIQNSYQGENVTVSGTVKDGSGIVTLTRTGSSKDQGSEPKVIKNYEGQTGDVTWTDTFASADESEEITYKAVDKYGRETTEVFKYLIDKISPVVTVAEPASDTVYVGAKLSSIKSFSGTASDPKDGLGVCSDVNSVQYSLDNGATWTNVNGTAKWSVNIDFKNSDGTISAGSKTVKFRAVDNADNKTTESNIKSKTVIVDDQLPVIALSNVKVGSDAKTADGGIFYINNSFVIAGTVNDANYDSVICNKASGDAGYGTLVVAEPAVGSTERTFTYTVDASSLSGSYSYVFTVSDKAGQTSSLTVNVFVDKTAPTPVLFVQPYVSQDANGVYTVNGEVSAKGSSSDNDKVVETALYIYTDEACTTIAQADGHEVKETLSGNDAVNFTVVKNSYKLNDKTNYWMVAKSKDRAGNVGQTVAKLYIDQSTDKPVVEISNADVNVTADQIASGKNLFNTTGNNKLRITATDDDGISSIVVKCSGASTPADWSPTFTSGAKAVNFDYVLPSTEGKYVVKVLVKDNQTVNNGNPSDNIPSGQTEPVGYNVGVDGGSPKLILTTQSGSFMAANQQFTVTGTVEDSSGKVTLYRYAAKTIGGTAYTAKQLAALRENGNAIADSEEAKIEVNQGTVYNFSDVYSASQVGNAGRDIYYVAEDLYKQCSTVNFAYSIDSLAPTVLNGWTQPAAEQNFTKVSNYTYKAPLSDAWDKASAKALYSDAGNKMFSDIQTVTLKIYRETNSTTPVKESILNKGNSYNSSAAAGTEQFYYNWYETDFAYSTYGDGIYTAKLFAKDASGNETPANAPLVTFTNKIDTTKPVVDSVSAKIGDESALKIGHTLYAKLDDNTKYFTISANISDAVSGITTSEISKVVLTDTFKSTASTTVNTLYDSSDAAAYTNVTVTGSGNGTYTFKLKKALIQTGEHTYTITATDAALNENSTTIQVSVDVTPPTFTINAPTPYVAGTPKKYNGKIKFSGTATDETELANDTDSTNSVNWELLSSTGASLGTPVTGTAKLSGNKSSGWDFVVDTTKVLDGTYRLKVSFTDKVGNVSTNNPADYEYIFDQSTNIPVISLSNATKTFKGTPSTQAGHNLFGMGSDVIYGSITDDDGIASYTYKVDSKDPVTVAVTGAPTSYSFTIDVSGYGAGDHTLSISALDVSNSLSDGLSLSAAVGTTDSTGVKNMKFGYDNDLPSIEVNKVNGTGYTNNMWGKPEFPVWLKVSDATSTDGSALTVTCTKVEKQNASLVYEDVDLSSGLVSGEVVTTTWDSTNKVWVHSTKNTADNYRRTYTVSDKYGRKATAQILYKVDNAVPLFKSDNISFEGTNNSGATKRSLTYLASNTVWFSNDAVKLNGSVVGDVNPIIESNPGTLTLTLSSDAANPITINTGTNNVFTSTVTFPQGVTTYTLKEVDAAGNEASVTGTLRVDTQEPAVTNIAVTPAEITKAVAETEGRKVTVSCEISDVNGTATVSGLNRIVLKDGATVLYDSKDASKTGATCSNTGDSYSFTIAANTISTGNHTYTVEAYDLAQNKGTASTSVVAVDVTVPELTINGFSPAVDSYANGIITVSGTVLDTTKLKDTDGISWEILTSADAPLSTPVKGTINLAGKSNVTESWSFNLDTTTVLNNTTTAAKATYKIKVTAYDAVSNPAEKTLDLPIDQTTNIPSVTLSNADATVTTEAGVNTTTNLFGMGSNELLGYASDDNGIASIAYVIDEGVTGKEISGSINMNGKTPTTKNFSIDLSKVNSGSAITAGSHTIKLVVTDTTTGLSVTSPIVKTVGPMYFGYDTEAPKISVSTINDSAYKNGMFIKSANAIKGTVSDDSVVAGVYEKSAYTTDKATATNLLDSGSTTAFTENTTNLAETASGETTSRTYVVVDKFGRTSEAAITFKVDVTRPSFATGNIKFSGSNSSGTNEITYAAAIAESPKVWFKTNTIKLIGSGSSSDDGKALVEANPESVTLTIGSTPYTINPGTNNAFSTTAEFTEGSNNYTLSAVDQAGNTVQQNLTFGLNIDTVAPVVSAVEFTDNGKHIRSSSITVKPTVTETGSGIKKIYVGTKANFTPSEKIGEGTASGTSISCTLPNTLNQGPVTVYVYAEDNAGNKSDCNAIGSFTYDTTGPLVKIDDIANKGTTSGRIDVNGNLTVSGTASDTYDLAEANAVSAKYLVGTATKVDEPDFTSNSAVALTVTGSSLWSTSIKTAELTDNVYLYIQITAVDKAGNSTSVVKTVFMNQYTNRPVIQLNELKTDGSTTPTVRTLVTNITGTLSDDDGIEEFKVSPSNMTLAQWKTYDPTAAVTIDGESKSAKLTWASNSSFNYTPADIKDGEHTLYFYIKDKSGFEFFTSNSTSSNGRPLIEFLDDKNAQQKQIQSDNNSVIKYKTDTKTPEVTARRIKFLSSNTADAIAAATAESIDGPVKLGGAAHRYAVVEIDATDSSGIKSVVGEIAQGSTVKDQNIAFTYDSTKASYICDPIDFSKTQGYSSASYTMTVRVTDNADLTYPTTITVNVYNDNPAISIDNVVTSGDIETTKLQTGDVTISGMANATSGVTLSKLAYLVMNNQYKTDLTTDALIVAEIKKIASTQNNSKDSNTVWEFVFDGKANGSKVNAKLPQTKSECLDYSQYGDSNQQIFDIPVYFYAEDEIGNWTLKKDFVLHYNPYENRPNVTITYPAAGGNNVLSGVITVTGNATDNSNKISGVYYQIKPHKTESWADAKSWAQNKFAGAFKTKASISASLNDDADEDFWGLDTGASDLSWNVSLNTGNGLQLAEAVVDESATDKTYQYDIRAVAIDQELILGNWSESVTFKIDPSAPGFKNAYLAQFNDSGVEIARADYSSETYLKGKWYLVLDVDHETAGIKDLSFTVSNKNEEKVEETASPAAGTICDSTGAATADERYVISKTAKGSYYNYKIKIPLTTGGTDKSGTNTVVIHAKTGGNVDGMNQYTVTYDNKAPVIKEFKVNGKKVTTSSVQFENDNNCLEVGSTVEDGVAGVSKVLFYFWRDTYSDAGKTTRENGRRLYDAMLNKNYFSSQYKDSADNALVGIDVEDKTSGSVTSGITVKEFKTTDNVTVPLYGKTYTDSSRSADNKFKLSAADVHVRKGGLIYIGSNYYLITDVSDSNEVTFNGSLDKSNSSYNTAFFPYAQVVDNTLTTERVSSYSAEPFEFSSGDDGDGMPESLSGLATNKNWSAFIHGNFIPDGDVTFAMVAFDNAGNASAYTINGQMANNTPRLAKVFLGTDLNGNDSYEESEYELYNMLGVEGSSQESYGLVTSAYKTTDTYNSETGKWVVSTSTRNPFKIKNGLSVAPEFVNGNGVINMVLNNNEEQIALNSAASVRNAAAKKTKAEADSSATDGIEWITPGAEVTFTVSGQQAKVRPYNISKTLVTKGKASADDCDRQQMSFTFWDSLEGSTSGVNTLSCFLRVLDFVVDQNDDEAPTAVVNPFYWKSKTDNSIYGKDASGNAVADNRVNGHIELPSDLPEATFSSSNSNEFDLDPKVSGKIVIRGSAQDETRLGSLWFAFDGFTPANFLTTVTPASYGNTAGQYTRSESGTERTYYLAATYNASTNAWTTAGTFTSDSWHFEVLNDSLKQTGHTVDWELSIDTSKISSVAGADKSIRILAMDAADTVGNVSNNGGTTAYQMDVVPYVMGIATELNSKLNSSVKDAYTRTSTGKYIVRSGETITFNGFNLSGAKIVKTEADSSNSIAEATEDLGTGGTLDSSKITSSRAYRLKVGSVYTLNNVNNNFASGSSGTTITDSSSYDDKNSYAYNSKANNKGNSRLTDDVYIDLWQFDSDAAVPESGELREPVMKINPKSGKIGFAFVAGPSYASMADGNNESFKLYQQNYATFNNISMAFDDQGYSYGTMTGLDTYPQGNTNTYAGRFTFMTSRWSTDADSRDDNYNYENKLRLEAIGVPGDSKCYVKGAYPSKYQMTETRFASPSIVATSHGTNTSVYLAYYDSIQNQIRFRYGKTVPGSRGNTLTSGNFDNFIDNTGLGDVTNTSYGRFGNNGNFKYVMEANTSAFSLIAGSDWQKLRDSEDKTNGYTKYVSGSGKYFYDTGYSAGKFVSIDANAGASAAADTVVAVWYDGKDCRYAYTTNPTTGNDNGTEGGWTGNKVIFTGGGEYCSVKFGPDGSVHIAAYVNGGLRYAYLSSASAAYSEATDSILVDSYGDSGKQITLDVGRKAVTVGGTTSYVVVPYIGYYSGGCMRPATASLVIPSSGTMNYKASGVDSENFFTGNWEVSVIPTPSSLSDNIGTTDKINIGLWKKSVTINETTTKGVITSCSDDSAGYTQRNTSSSNQLNNDSSGHCYGNGTVNPVFGYSIKDATGAFITVIETAQLK